MRRRSLSIRVLLPIFFCCTLAAGHDLSASYATLRFKPEALELQVKIAADTAWAAVQQKVAPGTTFVMEEFETVGRPLLITFARMMEELSAAGKPVNPREISVVVVEDNFIFTFTYPRPAQTPVVLKEIYLKQMSSDYVSRVVLVDSKDEPVTFKTLHGTDLVFEVTVPSAAAEAKHAETKAAKP